MRIKGIEVEEPNHVKKKSSFRRKAVNLVVKNIRPLEVEAMLKVIWRLISLMRA